MTPSVASKNPSSDAASFVDATPHFDFVVVGGGTAGLAVAARLSEDPSVSVAVLESGGHALDDPRIDTPGMFGAGLMTEHDWKIHTEQGTGAGAGVPSTYWPRGNCLGGSSALNFLVWDRPSTQELDALEELGNKGWNWKSLYYYMKKAEHFHLPSPQVASELHIKPSADDYGNAGPIQVSFPFYIGKQTQNWIPALESLGIPRNDHSLGGSNVGESVQPSIIDPATSKRSYSASAYLEPNLDRPNLKVLTGALVDKIQFANASSPGEAITATGVVFQDKSGASFTLQAKREVILSAGTVFTPAILERSGIGSKQVLEQAGVQDQLVDLPGVGENLQDHTYSSMSWQLQEGNVTLDSLRNDPEFAAKQQELYKRNSQNPGSILTEGVPTVAYISLEELVGKQECQKLVKEAEQYVAQCDKPYKPTLQKQLEWLQKYPEHIAQMELIGVDGFFATNGAPEPGKNYMTLLAAQQHLFSRGSVHIASADVSAHPKIDAGYFTAPWDLSVATAGTRFLRKIAGTKQYASYIDKEVVPGSTASSSSSSEKEQEDLEQYTRTIGTTTEYHHLGSASMLPREHGGVVDADLRVYGTRNVRCIDASIMPIHVSAHIQALVYGIAEAGADLIKREHALGGFKVVNRAEAPAGIKKVGGVGPQVSSCKCGSDFVQLGAAASCAVCAR